MPSCAHAALRRRSWRRTSASAKSSWSVTASAPPERRPVRACAFVPQRASRRSRGCARAGGVGPSSAAHYGAHWAAPPPSPAGGALSAEERALRVMQLMQDAQAAAARKPAADTLGSVGAVTPSRRRAWSPPVQPLRAGTERGGSRSRSPGARRAGDEDAHPLPSRVAAGRHAKEAVRAAVEEERRRAHTFTPALHAPRRNSPSPQPLPSTREAHLEQVRSQLASPVLACFPPLTRSASFLRSLRPAGEASAVRGGAAGGARRGGAGGVHLRARGGPPAAPQLRLGVGGGGARARSAAPLRRSAAAPGGARSRQAPAGRGACDAADLLPRRLCRGLTCAAHPRRLSWARFLSRRR